MLTAKDLRLRNVLTSGVIAGTAIQLLQTFGFQTAADEEVYAGYVRTQRFKGWQEVRTRFPRPPAEQVLRRAVPPPV